ncbi:MAG: hypothetical protein AAF299_07875 [Pseudomonadota bacterium]
MNPKSFTIATAFALCLGVVTILLKLSLPNAFFAVLSGMIFFMGFWRLGRGVRVAEDSYKSNETLFEQKVTGVISTVMALAGIGVTYILVNHVLDFQSSSFDCASNGQFLNGVLEFECTEDPGKTAVKFWIFFSSITIAWSLGRRYLVREHWDEL